MNTLTNEPRAQRVQGWVPSRRRVYEPYYVCGRHTVWAPSSKPLQKLFLCFFFSELRESLFNSSNTVIMHFWPRKHKGTFTRTFPLGVVLFESVDEVSYHGHVICLNMKNYLDINRDLWISNTVRNILIGKFSSCNTKVKKELFRTYCTSFYCRALWATHTVESARNITVCQNHILRRMFGAPRWSSATYILVVW